MKIRNVKISGTGSYVPDRVVTNDELSTWLDTNDEWIRTRTGILERRWEEEGVGTAEMAEHAARKALDDAGLKPEDIDLIVFATVTPDLRLPSAAALLQKKLGAKNAAGFDIAAACAGSIYAMRVADRFIASGGAEKALIIGAEKLTSIFNKDDRATAVLFGDAAGAAVLEVGEEEGEHLIDAQLYLDGEQWEAIHIPKGGSMAPPQADLPREDYLLSMKGREVYKYAVRSLTQAANDILEKNGLTADDIKCVVAHQANMRIIEGVTGRIGIPLERWVTNLDRYGNTSAASALMALDEARLSGRVKPGEHLLFLAIGAGLAWGAALYRA